MGYWGFSLCVCLRKAKIALCTYLLVIIYERVHVPQALTQVLFFSAYYQHVNEETIHLLGGLEQIAWQFFYLRIIHSHQYKLSNKIICSLLSQVWNYECRCMSAKTLGKFPEISSLPPTFVLELDSRGRRFLVRAFIHGTIPPALLSVIWDIDLIFRLVCLISVMLPLLPLILKQSSFLSFPSAVITIVRHCAQL